MEVLANSPLKTSPLPLGEGQGEGRLRVFPANGPHPNPPPEGEGASNSVFQRAASRNSGEFRYKRVAASLFSVSVLSLLPSMAMADGGTIRLSEQKGYYQLTIFT